MEACATGKPVEVFHWQRRKRVSMAKPGAGLYGRLVEWGLVKPPRDFDAYHRVLEERGLVTRLGGAASPALGAGSTGHAPDDLERVAGRVRELVARGDRLSSAALGTIA